MAFAPAKAMQSPAFARIANGYLGETTDALPALGRATHAFVRKDMIGKARPFNSAAHKQARRLASPRCTAITVHRRQFDPDESNADTTGTQPIVQCFQILKPRYWRTREDSNLWPLPSEGSALSS